LSRIYFYYIIQTNLLCYIVAQLGIYDKTISDCVFVTIFTAQNLTTLKNTIAFRHSMKNQAGTIYSVQKNQAPGRI